MEPDAATPQGVAFPLVDGGRSTSATGRAVFAAAARTVDADLAERIEAESDWRTGYLTHLRDLVEADLRCSDDTEGLPRAGLDALHTQLVFRRGGDEVVLRDAFDVPLGPLPGQATVAGLGSTDEAPTLAVPYRNGLLAGDALQRQLDAWVEAGTVEPSFSTAIGGLLAEPDRLDLRDATFVLLGAGAQMGPLATLCRWGATVVPVDLPVPSLWRRILATVRSGTGRAIVPLHREPDGGDDDALADAAGSDLVTAFPELARWLEELDGPLIVGTYAYADGADHVRVTMAADAIVERLLARRTDVTLACLLTPTDVYAAPSEVVDDARSRLERSARRRRLAHAVSGGRTFVPNYPATVTGHDGAEFGIADGLVRQQGPNYALAKRAQRWRMRVARHQGVAVSANVAPATSTRSVTKNRLLAAAYAGAPRYDVEVFDPETTATLEAALLVRDLTDPGAAGTPGVALPHPLILFADAAAHGGMWRQPYAPRSVLPIAALRGLARPGTRSSERS